MEIKKILDDTRQLQKEINSLEGQLDRCFSIADETLFRVRKLFTIKGERKLRPRRIVGIGRNEQLSFRHCQFSFFHIKRGR